MIDQVAWKKFQKVITFQKLKQKATKETTKNS